MKKPYEPTEHITDKDIDFDGLLQEARNLSNFDTPMDYEGIIEYAFQAVGKLEDDVAQVATKFWNLKEQDENSEEDFIDLYDNKKLELICLRLQEISRYTYLVKKDLREKLKEYTIADYQNKKAKGFADKEPTSEKDIRVE